MLQYPRHLPRHACDRKIRFRLSRFPRVRIQRCKRDDRRMHRDPLRTGVLRVLHACVARHLHGVPLLPRVKDGREPGLRKPSEHLSPLHAHPRG